ncbi:hypothetical protein EV363DRAFT_1398184 [Boletus edulis]|nr:hypothetical protein EV363DRAFT_1398184 [Boletus edulis]
MLDDAPDNALNQAVVTSANSVAKISIRSTDLTTQNQVGSSNDDSDAVSTLKSYWLGASTQPCDGTAIAAVSLSPSSELVLILIQGTPPPLNIYMPSTDT